MDGPLLITQTTHSRSAAVTLHKASSDARKHQLCFQENKIAQVEGAVYTGLFLYYLHQFIQTQTGNLNGTVFHSEGQQWTHING